MRGGFGQLDAEGYLHEASHSSSLAVTRLHDTLARRIADDDGRQFVTLDDEQSRLFAEDDPTGFASDLKRAVIEEIQRAPNLILALKRVVDEDLRPGRFPITGSVDLFAGSLSPDSLAGRVETVELLPFSQAEIAGTGSSSFIDQAFACDFAGLDITGPTDDLVRRVVGGGFPEALSRTAPARRQLWLRNYARVVAEHDVRDIAQVSKRDELPRLIDHAATAVGGLLNMSALGTRLGVDGKTVDRWLVLLEHMFLIRRVRGWNRNDVNRLVKAPKLQFLDSGLLAALQSADTASSAKDRQRLGTSEA